LIILHFILLGYIIIAGSVMAGYDFSSLLTCFFHVLIDKIHGIVYYN
jgi:hypothetical protein